MAGKFSERDICTKFITTALLNVGWDLHQSSQLKKNRQFGLGSGAGIW